MSILIKCRLNILPWKVRNLLSPRRLPPSGPFVLCYNFSMNFSKLQKLKRGDKVAILSPSFAGPAVWPHVYELGLSRLRDDFGLIPVEYSATKKLGASKEERTADLISAFSDKEIKAVISTIGGDDQITYIKNLPTEPFKNNPKPFFGYSDNTHFAQFLWNLGIPSFYGGSILTQYAMQGEMDSFTVKYLNKALFEGGRTALESSDYYSDKSPDWNDIKTLNIKRDRVPNVGWIWDDGRDAKGILWGGCLESIDEILRHGLSIPALEQFENIVLMVETSEELPTAENVYRVFRALGERGVLGRIKGLLVGRPKSWYFNSQKNQEEIDIHQKEQREAIIKAIREYNKEICIVQNMDFGHTDPQIPMPMGSEVEIDVKNKKIFVNF